MGRLTERDRVNLRWMIDCNARRIGYLGPSVRRCGPNEECAPLVERGLAKLNQVAVNERECGYWITDAGRAALKEQTP